MTNIKTIAISLFLFFLVFYPCLGNENKPTQSLEPTNPTVSNPIDRLIQKLNSDTHDMWVNGIYPIIRLPEDTKLEEVLAQAVKMTGFDRGYIKTYKIREVRRVKLNAHGMDNCSAAMVESDLGTKILLFRYQKRRLSWWTSFYDAPDEKQDK